MRKRSGLSTALSGARAPTRKNGDRRSAAGRRGGLRSVLAEDLTGQGHITRVVGDQPRFYAIVPLAEH